LLLLLLLFLKERKKERDEEIQIQQKRENCDSLARELSLKQSDRADKWKPNNVLQHRNNNTWKIDR